MEWILDEGKDKKVHPQVRLTIHPKTPFVVTVRTRALHARSQHENLP